MVELRKGRESFIMFPAGPHGPEQAATPPLCRDSGHDWVLTGNSGPANSLRALMLYILVYWVLKRILCINRCPFLNIFY